MDIYQTINKFLQEDEYEKEGKFVCECGKIIKKHSKYYHLLSNIHKKLLTNQHTSNH